MGFMLPERFGRKKPTTDDCGRAPERNKFLKAHSTAPRGEGVGLK
jgi:hypothetical protein